VEGKKSSNKLVFISALLLLVFVSSVSAASPSVEQNILNYYPESVDSNTSIDVIIDDKGEMDIVPKSTKYWEYTTNSSANIEYEADRGLFIYYIEDTEGYITEKENLSAIHNNLQDQPVSNFNNTLKKQKYTSKYKLLSSEDIVGNTPRSNYHYISYTNTKGIPEDSSKDLYMPVDGFEDQDLNGWSTKTSGSNGVIEANTSQASFVYEGSQAWHVRGDATTPEGKVFTGYRETGPINGVYGASANAIFPLNNNNTAVNTFDLGIGNLAGDEDKIFIEGNATHLNLRSFNGSDEALLASRKYDNPSVTVNNWLKLNLQYNSTSGIAHGAVRDADTGEVYAEVARHVQAGQKNGDQILVNSTTFGSTYFSTDFYTPGSDSASVFIDNLGYGQATNTNSSSNRDFTYSGKIRTGFIQGGTSETLVANFTGDFIDLAGTVQGQDVSEAQGQPHTLTNQFVNTAVKLLANNSVDVFFQDLYLGDVCKNQVNGSMPPSVTQEEIANQCNLTQTQDDSLQLVQDLLEVPSNVNIESNYDATNKLGINNTESFGFTDVNVSAFFKGYRDKLDFEKSYQGFENGVGNIQVIVPPSSAGDILYKDTTTNRSVYGSSSLKFEGRGNLSANEFAFVAGTFPISYSTDEQVKQISVYTYFDENTQGETAPSGTLSFSSQPTPPSDFLQLAFAPNSLSLRAGTSQESDNLGGKIFSSPIKDEWVQLELTLDNTTGIATARVLNASTDREIQKITAPISETNYVNGTERFEDGFISGNFVSPTDTAQSIFYDNLSVSNDDFTRKEGCELTSDGLVDVGGSSNNPVINDLPLTCDTGEVTGTSLQQDNQSYNYSATLDVYRSETEQSNLIYTIDNSQLPNISQAGGTPEVYLDGEKKPDIKLDVGGSITTINYTTSCCSSSPSAGTHSTKLSYSTGSTDQEDGGNDGDEQGYVKTLPQGKAVGLRSNPLTDLTQESNAVEGVQDIVFGNGQGTGLAAQLRVNMSASNVSAENLVFDTNRTTAKSVVHNTSSVANLKQKSLLIPRIDDTGKVHICPGVESMSFTKLGCSGGYNISTGETVNGVTLSEVTINGYRYYEATGITGTGGVEVQTKTSSGGGLGGGGGSEENEAPTASFQYSPKKPEPGLQVSFVSQSSDPDGNIAELQWKVNGTVFANESTPRHKFSEEGVYNVSLLVTDNDGATSAAYKMIQVKTTGEGLSLYEKIGALILLIGAGLWIIARL
jgi:hypothetical protein